MAVLLKDRFDMPDSIHVTEAFKSASYVADRARIENAGINRELRRWSIVVGEEEEKISREQK